MVFDGKRCAFIVTAVSVVFLNCCRGSGLGRCPKHEYVKDFNITRFLGHWYEVERTFYIMELTSICMDIDLNRTAKGQIEVTVMTRSRWSGNLKVSEGILIPAKRDRSIFVYRVNSTLPNSLSRYLPGAGWYQVLNTDYDRYAVIWTCSNLGLFYTDHVWVFGREKEIDVKLRTEIYSFLATKKIDSERLILPKNSSCIVD